MFLFSNPETRVTVAVKSMTAGEDFGKAINSLNSLFFNGRKPENPGKKSHIASIKKRRRNITV
jgi:hypothetical protein